MGLRRFIRNIRKAFRRSAWSELDALHEQVDLLRRVHEEESACIIPLLSYVEILYRNEAAGVLGKPRVMSAEDTLKEIATTQKSLIRYGEGELQPIDGGRALFQCPNERLGARLAEILQTDREDIVLCIQNWLWFWPEKQLTRTQWDWWFLNRPRIRQIAERYLLKDKIYGETSVTHLYGSGAGSVDRDYCGLYSTWRQIWDNKDIVVICGDRVFNKLEYNVFDNASSIEYLYVPTCDAFEEYDAIYARARAVAPHKLIVIMAGPTATVLAYDLTVNDGRRALDVGHLAKDYDCWKRQLTKQDEALMTFWEAD